MKTSMKKTEYGIKKTTLVILLMTFTLYVAAQFQDNSDLFYNGSSNSNNTSNPKGLIIGDLTPTQSDNQIFGDITVMAGKARLPQQGGGGPIVGPGTDPTGPPIPVGNGFYILMVFGVIYMLIAKRKKYKSKA